MASKLDSVLAHTLARVLVVDVGPDARKVTKWDAFKASPKAARITTFLVCWAQAERELGREISSVEEYREIWNESQRSAYRHQAECRAVWGEENFRPVIDALKKAMDRQERKLNTSFNLGQAMSLQVAAEAAG